MKQASQPGFYTRDDGVDVFIPAGAVRPNSHQDVARTAGAGWLDVAEDEAPEPKKAGVAEADQPRRTRRSG